MVKHTYVQQSILIIVLLVTKTCQQGDGNGNPEVFVGKANDMDDCVRKVRLQHLGADGASFKDCGGQADKDTSCGNCFAEYEMDGSNDDEDFKSCLIETGRFCG